MHLQAKKSDIVHVSMQLDFCYITLMWGAPFVGFQQPSLKFAQLSCSFASQHTHVSGRCRRRGVWRGGVEGWGGVED